MIGFGIKGDSEKEDIENERVQIFGCKQSPSSRILLLQIRGYHGFTSLHNSREEVYE